MKIGPDDPTDEHPSLNEILTVLVPGQHPVSVTRQCDTLTVAYGKQIKVGLAYHEAAREFGCCVFHAMNCAGKLNDLEGNKDV